MADGPGNYDELGRSLGVGLYPVCRNDELGYTDIKGRISRMSA